MNLFNRDPNTPNLRGIAWNREPDDFATRIEAGDVHTLLNQEVVIEAGTNAIILTDGATQGVVAPGRYTLSSAGDKLRSLLTLRPAKQVTAIVVDTNDLDLAFRVEGAYTKDPIGLTVDLNVVVCVPAWAEHKGPPHVMSFFLNVMKGARRYMLGDLVVHLQPEVENAVGEFVRRYSAAELNGDLGKKLGLEEAVLQHLEKTLAREGFEFRGVRAARLFHPRLDAITHQREELLLQATEEQAKLDGRRRLFDVLKAGDIQSLAEETQRVEMHEKRAALFARMRRSVMGDKMDELRTDADMEKFVDGLDREKLLRAEDRAKFVFELKNAHEDRERARASLVARADMEERYERMMAEAQRKAALDEAQLAAQSKLARQQVESEASLTLLKAQSELNVRKAREDFERERQKVLDVDARTRQIEDARAAADKQAIELGAQLKRAATQVEMAQAQAKIADLEREQDRLDAELGMTLLERMKAIRRQDEAEREEQRLRSKQRDLEIKIMEMRAISEIEMARIRATQAHEIERIRAMGTLSPEALLALSPTDQGRLIVELQQTREYRGMSAEQIAMLMAAKSPALAQALTEKFKAESEGGRLSAEQKSLYERMVSMSAQAGADKATAEALREAMKLQQDTSLQMGGMIRDAATGVAKAQPGGAPPIVITGGQSGVVYSGMGGAAASGGEVTICPKCQHKSVVGVKFCSNCGHKFYD